MKMDHKVKRNLLEAWFYLGWARILIYLPFTRIAGMLGTPMQETPYILAEGGKRELAAVHDAIKLMSRYTPWDSKCLVRAIAGLKMLQRRGFESTLYLGTAKDNGRFIAHAWLRSGTFYITGEEGMEQFTVVGKFANLSMGEYIKGTGKQWSMD